MRLGGYGAINHICHDAASSDLKTLQPQNLTTLYTLFGKITEFLHENKGKRAKICLFRRFFLTLHPFFCIMIMISRIFLSIIFAVAAMTALAGVKPESDDDRFNGDRCYSFGDYETALKYYQRAVDNDPQNVRAMTRIAMMYKRGLGVKRNYKTALDWYAKAAAAGDASSVFNMGTFYLSGLGVKQNYTKALNLFTQASEKGCADASYQMGCLYFSGMGVPQDYLQALDWFQKAADHRYLAALVNIGYMCCNGYGVVKDPAIGVQWYLYAAKYGSADAMRNLGYAYSTGEGVDQDEEEALMWYQKAATMGDKQSIAYLRSIGKYKAPETQYEEVPLELTEEQLAEEEEQQEETEETVNYEPLPEMP